MDLWGNISFDTYLPNLAITTLLALQIGLSEAEYATFTELELAAFSVLLHCRRFVFIRFTVNIC